MPETARRPIGKSEGLLARCEPACDPCSFGDSKPGNLAPPNLWPGFLVSRSCFNGGVAHRCRPSSQPPSSIRQVLPIGCRPMPVTRHASAHSFHLPTSAPNSLRDSWLSTSLSFANPRMAFFDARSIALTAVCATTPRRRFQAGRAASPKNCAPVDCAREPSALRPFTEHARPINAALRLSGTLSAGCGTGILRRFCASHL